MKPGMIQATDSFERIVHWVLASSCIILFLSGLGMMFKSLNFLGTIVGGMKNLKYLHNLPGLVFGFSLIFAISMWWKEAGVIEMPEDLEWVKCAGGTSGTWSTRPRAASTTRARKCSSSPWPSAGP